MTWDKLGKINLLIVDDDAFNRQLVMSLLEPIKNIEFIEAKDGIEALSILNEVEIDMVLLDLHMPNSNGYETLKEIKKEPKYKYIPVAILTTDQEEKRKLFKLGADDFLSKPYSLYELESRIYFHIEAQQKEKLKDKNISKKVPINNESKTNKPIDSYSLAFVENSQKEFLYEIVKLGIQTEEDKQNIKVIAVLTRSLAELVGYGKKIANDISSASIIRNIGAIAHGKAKVSLKYDFSKEEAKAYEAYMVRSYHLVALNIQTEFLKISKKVILQQREHFDGSGFPKKRSGDEIHKVAYIISLVETFNALLTQKDYYKNRIHTPQEVAMILESLSGKRLEPQITKLFLEYFDYFIELRERVIDKNKNKETMKI